MAQILARGEDGFFLMVESGRIDHAHHENTANRGLLETVAMDDAVAAAMSKLEGLDKRKRSRT